MPHNNYTLLAWGSNCHSVELLQKKAVRVVNFKSLVGHTRAYLKKYESTQVTKFAFFPFVYTILPITQKQAAAIFRKL